MIKMFNMARTVLSALNFAEFVYATARDAWEPEAEPEERLSSSIDETHEVSLERLRDGILEGNVTEVEWAGKQYDVDGFNREVLTETASELLDQKSEYNIDDISVRECSPEQEGFKYETVVTDAYGHRDKFIIESDQDIFSKTSDGVSWEREEDMPPRYSPETVVK